MAVSDTMRWKLTITETEFGPALILPDDLLKKLGVEVDDRLQFDRSQRGIIVKKAPNKNLPESSLK